MWISSPDSSRRHPSLESMRSDAITVAGRTESAPDWTRMIPDALRSSKPPIGSRPPSERSRIQSSFVSG